jgi:rod shape-determining protein MreD
MNLANKRIHLLLYKFLPLILLYTFIINDFDFNYTDYEYFSFNFSYIIIFYYSLKRSQSLGYIYIFIAGLFNDVIIGTPIGLSSLIYLVLCGAGAYLRNITLRPSLIKDGLFFLLTILIVNSILFLILNPFFNYELNSFIEMINIAFTFILYFLFSKIFDLFESFFIGTDNVR